MSLHDRAGYNIYIYLSILFSAYQLYAANIIRGESARKGKGGGSSDHGDQQDPEAQPSSDKIEDLDPKDPRYTAEVCKQFKSTLCYEGVKVHFVGVWWAPQFLVIMAIVIYLWLIQGYCLLRRHSQGARAP